MNSIAVFTNNSGTTTSFDKDGLVKVYTNKNSTWSITKEFDFKISDTASLSEIRIQISDMVKQISPVKIFIAKKVIGQIYYILESNNFIIYEIEGHPEKFLDSILNIESERTKTSDSINSRPSYIKDLGKNVFEINLIEAIKISPDMTSKRIILPYLKNKNFNILHIYCSHLPKWIEKELKTNNFKYTIDTSHSKNKISIYGPNIN